jgi:hypothetical protein
MTSHITMNPTAFTFDGRTGERVPSPNAKWLVTYRDDAGQVRKRTFKHKHDAQRLLVELRAEPAAASAAERRPVETGARLPFEERKAAVEAISRGIRTRIIRRKRGTIDLATALARAEALRRDAS